ncbi:helix-turn-helix DNA binding protein [Mycobacterium phage prophi91-3]|uniref:MerR family transcriptional regulator n=1 Tax=Mycobacteroides abscessus TaxID=36809 RepID=UPI0019D1B095|nr:helix-turn-helix domain-containing protein [Mycobacteroides abscessus]QSM88763.1 helix-turn-helix domain-containing protein [Mycobacteroides abscessus subsp. bolletii]QST90006.1 helix-turn-helix DNA binding protein [Mycobacterium phage prophi91-3]
MADIALFTTSEVADRLRVDSSTIRKWVAKGQLKAITLPGGHHRFRLEDVEALLAETSKSVAS